MTKQWLCSDIEYIVRVAITLGNNPVAFALFFLNMKLQMKMICINMQADLEKTSLN